MNPSVEQIRSLHTSSLIFLGYTNAACRFLPDGGMDYGPFFKQSRYIQGCLPRLRKGGVDVIALSFGASHPDIFPGRQAPARQMQHLGAFLKGLRRHDDIIAIAHSVREVRALRRSGKLAVLLHLTGVHLEGSLGLLHAFHALGVRAIHPPFDNRTQARVDAWQSGIGLTPFARSVVKEMEHLGMVIDLAHASDRMIRQVLKIVNGPVVISHGTCRAISNTKRNATDDQIRAVAETGGVIGVHFAGQLIDDNYRQRMEASDFHGELRKWEDDLKRRYPDPFEWMHHRFNFEAWTKTRAYAIEQEIEPPALDRIVDNIDHMVEVAGIDHVGVGPDYDLGNMPRLVDHADKLMNLTRALVKRGYSKTDIRKIWGGNFMRVYRQVLGD